MDVNAPAGTRYTVTHRTQYAYGATMADGYSVAYLLTRATPSQRVLSSVISTEPRVDEYDEWPDVFGNRMVQLGVHQPHTDFVVEAVSEVVTYRQERPRANHPWERVVAQVAALRGPLVLETSAFAAASRYVTVAEHRDALAPDGGRVVLARSSDPRCRRGTVHVDLPVVLVRSELHRREHPARRPCSRPAAGCARTSPTSRSAACGRSGSPPAT